MWYVGLDLHLRHTTICALDDQGCIVKQLKVRGAWRDVVAVLESWNEPLAVCFEASCGYGHLYDVLMRFAHRVVVAHPGQLRLIFRSKRKNDRIDAEKLAKLMFLDEVPAVHVPSEEVRTWRELIEHRKRLMMKRTRTKNSLRSLLRACGIATPRTWRLWTNEGVEWLKAVELPSQTHHSRRLMLLEELALFAQQVQIVNQALDRLATGNKQVQLLQTIPGIGPRTSEAVLAYVDRADRFADTKSIGSYFGLVPSQDQSGSTNRLGHITRQGPATVRHLLVEAVWQGIQRSPTIRAHFDRIYQGQEIRKKIALVATAHYVLRVMLAILKSGQPWREAPAA
ncbi:MAG TPA: IS110 family transposase [Pirellulales bacterium]|nr:IS110 family transposase [Pirellulales bacterium]